MGGKSGACTQGKEGPFLHTVARAMMDSTHGASNPFAGVPESASLSQTTYFDADAPPEAEGEESAYVSFTVRPPNQPCLPSRSPPAGPPAALAAAHAPGHTAYSLPPHTRPPLWQASEQAAAAMPPPPTVLAVPPPEPDFGASSQAFQDLDISTPALAAAAQPASRFESKVEPGPGSQASAGGASSPNLLVTVTNPCMEGQGISSHFTYEVTTKTSLPQYKFGQFSVTRRFRDFDWVRSLPRMARARAAQPAAHLDDQPHLAPALRQPSACCVPRADCKRVLPRRCMRS